MVGSGFADGSVDHQHRNIHAVEHLLGALDALRTEAALVVKARRVDNHNRSERQKLHRLGNRVGRGALDVGHHGNLLIGKGIDDARLARVAPAEKSDMHPLTRGRAVQAHKSLLRI